MKSFVATPRFRDPETGATWAGRGEPPNWFNGKNRGQLLLEMANS